MSEITIKTNHQYRVLLNWDQLTEAEQKDFDYLKTDDDRIGRDFIRYRGHAYDLGEFMRVDASFGCPFKGWDGYHTDSFFSAVLVKYDPEDQDRVKMGLALS